MYPDANGTFEWCDDEQDKTKNVFEQHHFDFF